MLRVIALTWTKRIKGKVKRCRRNARTSSLSSNIETDTCSHDPINQGVGFFKKRNTYKLIKTLPHSRNRYNYTRNITRYRVEKLIITLLNEN